MNLLNSKNILIEVFYGPIFFILGMLCILQRKKIIGALLLSNKTFWDRFGFLKNEKIGVFISNIVILIVGICLSVAGIFLTYKIIQKVIK